MGDHSHHTDQFMKAAAVQGARSSHHAPAGQIEAKVKTGQLEPVTTGKADGLPGVPCVLEIVETIIKRGVPGGW